MCAEAVEQVKKTKFDLILMDMQMPIMKTVLKQLKKSGLSRNIKTPPIYRTHCFCMKGDKEKCLNAEPLIISLNK
jgi:CheY-like chemotaxis protein